MEKYYSDEKEFNEILLSFLDGDDNSMEETDFFDYLKTKKLDDNDTEMNKFIILLSNISKNHHRSPFFIRRIVQILCQYQIAIEKCYTNSELVSFFNHSNLIFLFKYAEKIQNKDLYHNLKYFITNKIKNYLNSDLINQNKIDKLYEYPPYDYNDKKKDLDNSAQNQKISGLLDKLLNSFDSNQDVGENDLQICKIIREDLIDDFVIYVNQHNISLSMKIKCSITETNSFLLERENSTTLIEYAAFFGSTQIFQYLRLNNVEFSPRLWLYAIHGRNADIIHLLEETDFKTCDETFKLMLKEAILCYHNEIAFYIKDNLLSEKVNQDDIDIIGIENKNYSFYPNEFSNRSKKLYDCIIQDNKNMAQFLLDQKFIGLSQFENCSVIDKLIIPLFIKQIDDKSFLNCSSLTEISIPLSITIIGANALYGCNKLKQVIIPESVTMINSGAFKFCSALTEINIPFSVKKIGSQAFASCSRLKEIILPPEITTIAESTFEECFSLKKISIPSKVTSIEKKAFYFCMALRQIELPQSLNIVKTKAFCFCSSLEKITFPSSVTVIEQNVFERCSHLNKIEFEHPSSISSINPHFLEECNEFESYVKQPFGDSLTFIHMEYTSLKEICIPSSVTSILSGAFERCFNLCKITFESPSNIHSIGDNAFNECINLKQITIPSSVTSIGEKAFRKCKYLKKIVFEEPSSLTSLSDGIFMQCLRLKNITIPPSIETIGKNAFEQCVSLVSISFPSSVTTIGPEAFKCCKKLKDIKISSNINEINVKTFSECLSLEKVEIPSTITKINNNSFYKCLSLVDVTIHCSNTYIDPGAFRMCRKKNIVILNDEVQAQ